MNIQRKFVSYFFSIIPLLGILIFNSCEDELPLEKFYEEEGVFILNEGNYTYGNSSLSFYNTQNRQISNQVFFKTNGFPVGDVLQSMTLKDSLAFLVVNNSGKVLVMNANTFKFKAIIQGLVSPRQLLVINSEKAYISDLYSNSITIVHPGNFSILGNISLKKGSESMVLHGNYVFVGNWSKQNTIQRINVTTDVLIDTLTVTKQPNSMVLDKNEKLWVLSDGGLSSLPGGKSKACLARINPVSFTIEAEYFFPDMNSAPTRLCSNSAADTLFYLNGSWGSSVDNGGVYKMAITAQTLPEKPFISEQGRLFYALGVDPKNKDIYVSDAVDYLQAGWVFRYSGNGVAIDSFKTDIIPASFCFKYD